jgi:hypothetical protein
VADWSERVPNFDATRGFPYRRPLCTYCLNTGWVVAETGNEPADPEDFAKLMEAQRLRQKAKLRPMPIYGEAHAPCPFCDFGHEIEFPAPPKKGMPTRVPPFGPDGYWGEHGWLKEHLRPRPADSKPNMVVNRIEARTLAAKAAAMVENVEPVVADRPTPEQRKAALDESTVKVERAGTTESTDARERAVVRESTEEKERAAEDESTDQKERADRAESAGAGERAEEPNSTEARERAGGEESTGPG